MRIDLVLMFGSRSGGCEVFSAGLFRVPDRGIRVGAGSFSFGDDHG